MNEEKLTVKMFKMWISGVEEMQSEEWTPTPAQWSVIRKKIDMLDEEPSAVAAPGGDFFVPRPMDGQPPRMHTPSIPGLPIPDTTLATSAGPIVMDSPNGGVPLRLETQNQSQNPIYTGGRNGQSEFI